MKAILLICLQSFFSLLLTAQTVTIPYEQSGGTKTPTYQEIIAFYQQMDIKSGQLKLITMGPTDAGYPLHLALYSNDGKFDVANWHRQNKVVLLINNGIHPGEPDGIDASMLLIRDMISGKVKLPDNIVLAFIPVYNIGGCLNRSTFYRVDQNGPNEFGSRGNAQNLDLNRDFIKADSREARSFAQLYQYVNPDVFIDNHVSNGADYQHIMTLICSQHNKLGGAMGDFMQQQFEPGLHQLMKLKGYDLVPYVNAFGDTPETGWPEFLEGPRYSSGYATLWSSFAFVPETHMLKPYQQRVDATYELMRSFIDFSATHASEIKTLRKQTIAAARQQAVFPIGWSLDRTVSKEIAFKGYEAGKKASEISGLPRLYYDRNKPFTKMVKFYHQYKVSKETTRPLAYIIPQGWWKVVERLQDNKVQMQPLKKDTVMEVEIYRIADYKTAARPFEMHHLNSDVKLERMVKKLPFRKGDWYIPMNQLANRFLIETLEPHADDSYFAWNFFDGILGQKEGYSSYVFEDTGAAYLKQHPELQVLLDAKKKSDSVFATSASQQLDFIYKNAPYYEPDHLKYPVYRVIK